MTMTIDELQAAIDELRRLQHLVPTDPGPDWFAIQLPIPVSDPLVGTFSRHKYDISLLPKSNRVVTIFDLDYGEFIMPVKRCWPYLPLAQKRQEIAALLREGRMQSPPLWWHNVLTPTCHNAGIDAEIIELQQTIVRLAANRV